MATDRTRTAVLLLLTLYLTTCYGVKLSPCGDDNTAEIGKTDNVLDCSDLDNGLPVTWNAQRGYEIIHAVTCQAGTQPEDCDRGSVFAYRAKRLSGTQSQLVYRLSHWGFISNLWLNQYISCGNSDNNKATCAMDYVVPAKGSCEVQIDPYRLKVSGSCLLQPGASSSRNRFRCFWTRSDLPSWKYEVSLTRNTYQTGCVMSAQSLPAETGASTYTVTLIPGRQKVIAVPTTLDEGKGEEKEEGAEEKYSATYVAIVTGGTLGGFILLVVLVIVIVYVLKKRCETVHASKTTRKQDEEEEHAYCAVK